MDPGFLRRADRSFIDRTHARLDYDVLVASLAALQTSQAHANPAAASISAVHHRPLVELLTAGPGWRAAVALQDGRFNPTVRRGRGGGG